MVNDYEKSFTENEVELTKNKILKGNTRAFESLGAQLGILKDISKYDKAVDFLDKNQEELINMTLEDYKNIISTYIVEDQFTYLVVGDKATQLEEVKKLGKPVIELDIYGNEK